MLLIAAIAAARVVMTYPVFNHTFDEPAHLAAGMEWLDRGTYRYEPMHPPLARASVALLPYAAGRREAGESTIWREGRAILYEQGGYWSTLTLARLGVLPYLIVLCLLVGWWASAVGGPTLGVVAAGLMSLLPPVLAHAGLATTDVPFTALFILAVMLAARWLDEPRRTGRAVAASAAAAAAVLAKFSAIVFLPLAIAAMGIGWVWRHPRAPAALGVRAGEDRGAGGGAVEWKRINREMGVPMLAALGTLLLVTWAGYRFQVGWTDTGWPVPAPSLWTGLTHMQAKAAQGADAYLFGEVRTHGWWYFFLVTLAVKTPLPFLALAVAGAAIAWRRPWSGVAADTSVPPHDADRVHRRRIRLAADSRVPVLVAALLLAFTFTSSINLGVRHLLPVYPLLAIPAAMALLHLWERSAARRANRIGAGILVAWLAIDSVRAHPDYLAYFNELAGRRPERILVNGDLDWGQDLARLADTVQARRIDSLAIAYFGSADPRQHLPRVRPMNMYERPRGWFAVSEAVIAGVGIEPRDGFAWLRTDTSFIRIGRSIRLYHRP